MAKVTTAMIAGMLGLGLLVATGTLGFGQDAGQAELREAVRTEAGPATATEAGSATAAGQDRYVLDGDPAIYALAGRVEVVPGSSDRVEVVVELMGPDADRLSVDVVEVRGQNALVVRFPDDRIVFDRGVDGRGRTTMRVRDDGTWGGGMDLFGTDRVQISTGGSGLEAWASVRVEVPGGRDADVHVGAGSITARGVSSDLFLDVSSGGIDVVGHEGDVRADTGSGEIRLVDVLGSIDADTGSGDITIDGVTGDAIALDTGSGDVRVLGAQAPEFSVDTGSGDVDMAVVGPVRTLEVDTGSGDVTVRFATELDARVDIDTGSGGIDVDLAGLTTLQSERGEFSGVVGEGRGSVSIDTGSGGVRVLRGG
ncbi:MAG TPA: DUF4097 family beta strand repeat-containing protein [Longimicrobiales bacterium]|nr:DUF4097 family beta strand repeat-containing protein [Longimicrobiales bacterium]